MHDRKKKKHAPLSAEEQQRRDEEYKYIGGLYTKLIQENKRYTATPTGVEGRRTALQETECLLLRVPEAYSMYNYRRHVILDEIEALAAAAAAAPAAAVAFAHRRDATMELLKKELKLNTEILKNDFKVYAAFSYRNWVLNLWIQLAAEEEQRRRECGTAEGALPPPANTALDSLLHVLTKERQQCQLLLSLDARNFHMWNYRRSVLNRIEKVLNLQPPQEVSSSGSGPADEPSFFLPEEAEEIQFTTKEIKSNFSNYSAWHQRGYTIKKALARHGFHLQRPHAATAAAGGATGGGSRAGPFARTLYALVVEDLFLFTQSIFCDPNDQASYCYATFSLSMFRTFQAEILEQYKQQQQQQGAAAAATENEEIDALLAESGGDIMDCFVEGVVKVVTEQVALGESAACSLALFFLLQVLMQLAKAQRQGGAGAEEAAARLARYVHKIHTRIVAPPPQGLDGPAAQRETVAWLQQQLIQGDPLRRGMYEDIIKYM